jgi:hypothetical protein
MCAAVTAQSGKVIGVGAALDCHGGVPLLCAPALQLQSSTRILVMPLWGGRAECGEGNCRSYYYSTSNGRNCHLRKEVQLRGVFRFSEIIAIIVSCGRRSVEMGRSNE